MEHRHRDEVGQYGCAGEQEERPPGIYRCTPQVTIAGSFDVMADSAEVARNVALFRFMNMIEIKGNGLASDWDPGKPEWKGDAE